MDDLELEGYNLRESYANVVSDEVAFYPPTL